MPYYHTHFRQESKQVVAALHDLVTRAHKEERSRVADILRFFEASCGGLSGHVGIEEYHVFPELCRRHPGVSLQCLYSQHRALHDEQAVLTGALKAAVAAKDEPSEAQLHRLLSLAVSYDAALLSHLGEEEEFVVPMELLESSHI